MEVSVVIPVYNSQATLAPLIERLVNVLDEAVSAYEIVLVDDGSRDQSWAEIERLSRNAPNRIVGIQLMRNFGQHNAIMCGLRHAEGDYVVTMDDDLQNPPEEIPKLLMAARSQCLDVVYGVPENKEHPAYRNLGSRVVNAFFSLIFQLRTGTSAFRVLHRDIVQAILPYALNYTYIDGLLAWNTQRVGSVPVEHRPRQQGRSGYSLSKLIVLTVNLFTNFSLLPLQAVSLMGIASAGGGFLAGSYLLVMYGLGRISVPGYASTIVALLTLGGVQLVALGIIGEYLGRVHLNMNRKPQYTIRTLTGVSTGVTSDSGSRSCS